MNRTIRARCLILFSAALLVMDSDCSIAPANRAAQLLIRGEGARLSNITTVAGAAAAHQIEAMAPSTRAVLRLANGQQTLVSTTQFTDADGGARRLMSLQNVVGELDANSVECLARHDAGTRA